MRKAGLGGKRPQTFLVKEDDTKMDNRSRSVRHEQRLAKDLSSRTTPNSGATPFVGAKGDLQDDQFVWQAKLTKQSSLSLGSGVLMEVSRQAAALNKHPALALTLEGLPDPLEKDWVVIPAHVFKEMKESCYGASPES